MLYTTDEALNSTSETNNKINLKNEYPPKFYIIFSKANFPGSNELMSSGERAIYGCRKEKKKAVL